MNKRLLVVGTAFIWALMQIATAQVHEQKSEKEKPEQPKSEIKREEPRQLMKQLEDVSRALLQTEQAVIEADPALKAEQQSLREQIQQIIEKIRAFDEKVDDKVIATSPASQPLVKEKRELLAKLENQAGGKKGGIALTRMMRFLAGGTPLQGRAKVERRAK